MRRPIWLAVMLVGALAGLVFASVSTYDFVQHLDRQVHSLHCSFIPGGGADAGASGCHAAMMSPYSSVGRTLVWGGIPISLGAMAVFAYLLFYGTDVFVTRRKHDPRATGFLALATALPAAASVTMLTISLVQLGTTCKLCVGIYISSALCVLGAVMTWREARAAATQPAGVARDGQGRLEIQVEAPPTSNRFLAGMFGVGVLFVALPALLYLELAPDHGRFVGTCGELVQPQDNYGVMVTLDPTGRTPALEIVDPLCPACKAFETRLDASSVGDRISRKAILFPLDTTCNWMITENTHPGACTVSEAVLCAGDRGREVIEWAFEHQERIRTETKADPTAAARIVAQRFPELASCVGSSEARSRLNKSMRWVVANNIRVLTPQLFVNGVKLCDEDVDLGLDYALAKMLDGPIASRPMTAKPVEAPTPTHAPMPAAPATMPAATAPSVPAPTGAPAAAAPSAPGAAPAPAAPASASAPAPPAAAAPAPASAPAAPTEAAPTETKPVTDPTPETPAPTESAPPAAPTPPTPAPAAQGGNS